MNADVTVIMPYLAKVSVNSAYRRGSPRYGKYEEVEFWLLCLRSSLRDRIYQKNIGLPIPGTPVQLNIRLLRAGTGRPPDVSNFRKLPQDSIADELGIDDSVFYGTDQPLEKTPDNQLIFHISWTYEEKGEKEKMGYSDSVLYSGPLTSTVAKLFKIKEANYCSGFTSTFCLKCSDCPSDCPFDFSPTVLVEVPCKICTRQGCPCKGADNAYEERRARINLWWEARKASTKFERQNWPKDV